MPATKWEWMGGKPFLEDWLGVGLLAGGDECMPLHQLFWILFPSPSSFLPLLNYLYLDS